MSTSPSRILKINRATMCEAVEHWLNTTQFKEPATVTHIAYNSQEGGSFDVTHHTPAEEKKP